jgi:hypothetical protein
MRVPRLREGVLDSVELVVRVRADRADGGQADDDDQCEHDRVLDGCRAAFGSQELLDVGSKLFHKALSARLGFEIEAVNFCLKFTLHEGERQFNGQADDNVRKSS